MKKLLFLLWFIPTLVFAVGIQILDLDSVKLDGINAGKVEDVVVNYPSDAAAVKSAAATWFTDIINAETPQMRVASDSLARMDINEITVSSEDRAAIIAWREANP